MKKEMLVVMAVILCAMVFAGERKSDFEAFREKAKQERTEFREKLKNMPTENRAEAVKEFRAEQYQERRAALESRVSENTKLTAEQKADILKKADERHASNNAFVESVKADTTLTKEQKREKIHANFEAQREAGKNKLKELKNRKVIEENN